MHSQALTCAKKKIDVCAVTTLRKHTHSHALTRNHTRIHRHSDLREARRKFLTFLQTHAFTGIHIRAKREENFDVFANSPRLEHTSSIVHGWVVGGSPAFIFCSWWAARDAERKRKQLSEHAQALTQRGQEKRSRSAPLTLIFHVFCIFS